MKVRALLGRKIGMTQVFDESGQVTPVSVIKAGPCVVVEKKSSLGKDRYSAVKLGFETGVEKRMTKPLVGQFKKLNLPLMRVTKEVRVPEEQLQEFEVGKELDVTIFEPGDYVNVVGKTIGRGFSGVIRRWGFAGKRMTHGTHSYYRQTGSVGSSTWPSRIWKGKKMPGQYGNKIFSAQNLKVVQIIPEENLLLVKGSVPGHRNSIVLVRTSARKWKRG